MTGNVFALISLWLGACDASTTVSLLPGYPGAAGANTAESEPGIGRLADSGPWEPACRPIGGDEGSEVGAPAGLLNRYDFSGQGDVLCDLAGGKHGSIRGGAVLDGSGAVALDGVDDFVVLPAGMVSSLSSVTVAAWFTWRGARHWERVFDFGQTEAGDGLPGASTSHLFFTPYYNPGPGPSANYSIDGKAMAAVNGAEPFASGTEQLIAVVIDGAAATLTLYLGDTALGQVERIPPVSRLSDGNCWLGQSQQQHDAHTNGVYQELRVYGRALGPAEIARLQLAGPDRP